MKNPLAMQETTCNAGTLGLIPGSGEGNGNVDSPVDRGA